MNYFAKNLKYVMKRTRTAQSRLGIEVNKGQTTIGNWANGVVEPGIHELIIISNFFAITVSDFLLIDFEKANLITDEYLAEFKQKGNLKNKPADQYAVPEGPETVVNEEERMTMWIVAKELKSMQEKIDKVQQSVDKLTS